MSLSEATNFLIAAGLSSPDAQCVCQHVGASTKDDLKYIQSEVESVAKQVGLKLVAKKKFSEAIEKLTKPVSQPPAIPEVQPEIQPEPKSKVAEAQPAQDALPREFVAIAIDRSGSMGCCFNETQSWCDDGNQNALKKTIQRRSRMEAVKNVFYAFRDRTATLGEGAHQLGLLQFDHVVEKLMNLSSDLDLFECIVDDIEKRGSTAIYSAIIAAVEMLQPQFAARPDADFRVVLLTDGQNNAGDSPQAALQAAFEIGAVVDAIIVGDSPDTNLRKIVAATGGNCYQITTLSEGFELMEAEAVVSLKARRGGTDKPEFVKKQFKPEMLSMTQAQTIVRGKNASKAASKAIKAITATRRAQKMTDCATGAATLVNKASSAGDRRLAKELGKFASNGSPDGFHIYPDADNPHLMRVLMEGPPGTPFANGVFELDVTIPKSYPFGRPSIDFVTPIYHCNVSDSGFICMDALNYNWNPTSNLEGLFEALRELMRNPDTSNGSLRSWIAELTIMSRKSGGTDTRYYDAASTLTKTQAAKSVEEFEAQWCGMTSK